MHTEDRSSGTTHLVNRTGLGTGLAILAFLAMLMSGFSQPVGAQVDPASCGFFEFQEDAQDALEQNPELALTLDDDGDGIACETLPSKTVGGIDPEPTVGTTPPSTGNETVTALPSTGAGSGEQGNAPLWPLLVAGLVVAVVGLLSWPRHPRRLSDPSI